MNYFKLSNSLKAIDCFFVRPIVEYDLVIWDPQAANACKQLEYIKRRFLSFIKYTFNINCEPHDYNPVHYFLNLSNLAECRHQNNNISFLKKLLSASINSPSIFALINIKILIQNTYNNSCFVILHCTTNYLRNELLIRMLRITNEDTISFLY